MEPLLRRQGINREYITTCAFLNEFRSIEYFALHMLFMFLFGGYLTLFMSALVAFPITFAVRHFVLNKRVAVGDNWAVVITGTSSGIGFDSAKTFAEEGFIVYAAVRKDQDFEKLAQVVKQEAIDNGRLRKLILDVTDDQQIACAVKQVTEDQERDGFVLHAVINNAGIGNRCVLEHMSREKLQNMFNVNFFGALQVTNAFLPLLRRFASKSQNRPNPLVIFVSSGFGEIAVTVDGAYCCSKFALEAAADVYRRECFNMGVNFVVLQPGKTVSKFSDTALAHADQKDDEDIVLDSAIQRMYDNGYQKSREQRVTANRLQVTADIPTNTLREILLSPRPLPRYRCGPDSNLFLPLLLSLHSGVVDVIQGRSFK